LLKIPLQALDQKHRGKEGRRGKMYFSYKRKKKEKKKAVNTDGVS